MDVDLTLPQMVKYTSERVSLQTTTKQNIISTKQQKGLNIAKISFRRGLVDTVNAPTHSSADARGLNLGGNRIHERKSAFEERVIRILTWTNVSIGNNHWFGKHLEGVANCNTPISCEYSNNRSLYNISDLILFHTRLAQNNDAMPLYRLPHQHWVTFLRETPIKLVRIDKPHNSWFNWTIAYTLKADIARPYGICLPKMEAIAKDPSSITDTIRRVYRTRTDSIPWQNIKQNTPDSGNFAKGKTRTVLWAVSHCITQSKRERYVEVLKRHIKIDIIGKCGDDSGCKWRNNCHDVFKKYKFYLSFENAFCTDYITEKLWYRMEEGIVPIVLGGADYKAHLPAHSYIDVRDFASPKALAEYLHKLDNNDDLYNAYFVWRQNYTCKPGVPNTNILCDICRFMNDNLNKVNIIPDVNTFWSRDDCLSPEIYYDGILDGM